MSVPLSPELSPPPPHSRRRGRSHGLACQEQGPAITAYPAARTSTGSQPRPRHSPAAVQPGCLSCGGVLCTCDVTGDLSEGAGHGSRLRHGSWNYTELSRSLHITDETDRNGFKPVPPYINYISISKPFAECRLGKGESRRGLRRRREAGITFNEFDRSIISPLDLACPDREQDMGMGCRERKRERDMGKDTVTRYGKGIWEQYMGTEYKNGIGENRELLCSLLSIFILPLYTVCILTGDFSFSGCEDRW